jgi:hypothetical protein
MDHTASASIEQSRRSSVKNLLRPNVGGLDRAIRMLLGSILLAPESFSASRVSATR